MSILQLLIACSPEMTAGSGLPVDSVDVVTQDEDTAETEIHPVVGAEATLTLTVPPDLGGFYELRAFREDESGELWIGTPFQLGAIFGETVTVALPSAPPRRDLGDNIDKPVTYAVSLRAEDADAEPGIYVGLAKVWVAHVGGVVPSDATEGWNLIGLDESGARIWQPLSEGIVVDENLYASGSLDIGGVTSLDVGPTSHLTLSADELPHSTNIYDQPLRSEWSVSIHHAPGLQTVIEPVAGAVLGLYAYEDLDGDNARTDEEIVGSACFGPNPVWVTWYDYAYDLHTAFELERMGVRSGWEVLIDNPSGEGSVIVADPDSLLLRPTCG